MPKPNDLSRSLTAFEQDSTLIVVIEMSQASWLVAGIVLAVGWVGWCAEGGPAITSG